MNDVYKTREGYFCRSHVDLPEPTPKEFIYLIQVGEVQDGAG